MTDDELQPSEETPEAAADDTSTEKIEAVETNNEPEQEDAADNQSDDAADKGSEDSDDDNSDDVEQDSAPKKQSSSQRKSKKIAAQAQELAEKEAQIAALQRQLDEASKAEETPAQAPKVDDFEDYGDYERALLDFTVRDSVNRSNREAQQSATRRELERAQQDRASVQRQQFQEREAEAVAAKTMPDYKAKVSSLIDRLDRVKVDVPQHVVDLVQQSEKGPELLYSMANDEAFLVNLLQSNPLKAALEIGRREARLSAITPKTQSTAPAPKKPLKGGAGAPKTPDKMSKRELQSYLGYDEHGNYKG